MAAGLWPWVRRLLTRVGVLTATPGAATTKELGQIGERAAERHLRSLGFAVLGRNLLVPMGEADLLCRDPDRRTVVVVEVKTRLRRAGAPVLSNTAPPEASITAHKRRKLRQIAGHLTRANRWDPGCVRIDVVAVEYDEAGASPVIRHHRNAVACR